MGTYHFAFNPRSCDPVGEGEQLAQEMRDAGAVSPDVLIAAALDLGAQLVVLTDADDDIEQTLCEMSNDDRARLRQLLDQADTWVANHPDPSAIGGEA